MRAVSSCEFAVVAEWTRVLSCKNASCFSNVSNRFHVAINNQNGQGTLLCSGDRLCFPRIDKPTAKAAELGTYGYCQYGRYAELVL